MSTSVPSSTPLSYKDAGVDIDAGDALVERIKPLAKKTMREGVLAVCGFGPRASTRTMVEFDPAGKVWPGGTGGG